MLDTHKQCMTPVAAGNTNPVTLISYSFVCLASYSQPCFLFVFSQGPNKSNRREWSAVDCPVGYCREALETGQRNCANNRSGKCPETDNGGRPPPSPHISPFFHIHAASGKNYSLISKLIMLARRVYCEPFNGG